MTERELLARAVIGERDALNRLLNHHHRELMDYLEQEMRFNARLRRYYCPRDILQETFKHVIKDIGSFNPNRPAAFLGWMKTIAKRRLLDAIKRLSRKKRDYRRVQSGEPGPSPSSCEDLLARLSDGGITPSRIMARDQFHEALHISIANLPSEQRVAIQLRYFDSLSLDEVAERLHKSKDAVRGLLDRAKKNLGAQLRSWTPSWAA